MKFLDDFGNQISTGDEVIYVKDYVLLLGLKTVIDDAHHCSYFTSDVNYMSRFYESIGVNSTLSRKITKEFGIVSTKVLTHYIDRNGDSSFVVKSDKLLEDLLAKISFLIIMKQEEIDFGDGSIKKIIKEGGNFVENFKRRLVRLETEIHEANSLLSSLILGISSEKNSYNLINGICKDCSKVSFEFDDFINISTMITIGEGSTTVFVSDGINSKSYDFGIICEPEFITNLCKIEFVLSNNKEVWKNLER